MLLSFIVGCAGIDSLLTIEISESSQVTVEQGTLVESLLGDLGFGDFVSMNLIDSQELAADTSYFRIGRSAR